MCYDLSRQLDARARTVAARAVAIDAYGGTQGSRLAALADARGRARPARARMRRTSVGDGQTRVAARGPDRRVSRRGKPVLLARRFHNDAVRDTLARGTIWLVRLLRLGGTAVPPTHFEIVERPHALVHGGQGCLVAAPARVVLLDDSGAVLLLCGSDPAKSVSTARAGGGSPSAA